MSDASLDVAAVVRQGTMERSPGEAETPARFALELRRDQDAVALAEELRERLAEFDPRVAPLSALEPRVLLVELPTRTYEGVESARAFSAAYELREQLGLDGAEPDLPTAYFPTDPDLGAGRFFEESADGFPGCWVDEEPALSGTMEWALDRINAPEAWAFSEQTMRPAQGRGVVIAQPDTGTTPHAELAETFSGLGFNMLTENPDPSDPLDGANPGHGTGTGSVVVSRRALRVTGSAPQALHMPIRAIRSVVQITQITIARSIDWAVNHDAHVVTMSLGGLPSPSVHRAIRRAVNADVLVLAAAGNCVRTVVWPARYEECIAVAGTNAADAPWPGSCRGAAVDISAPGQNVYRAAVPTEGPAAGAVAVGQGQGTSFAVALAAGVAALWLAHHGRANLIGQAHARGETLQAMFRRLLQATARRPPEWDAFDMGPGIVDARALLEADLDLGRDREVVELLVDPRLAAQPSAESLVAETVGVNAVGDETLDWNRYGAEIAALLLDRQLYASGLEAEAAWTPAVSSQLAGEIANATLRRGTRLR